MGQGSACFDNLAEQRLAKLGSPRAVAASERRARIAGGQLGAVRGRARLLPPRLSEAAGIDGIKARCVYQLEGDRLGAWIVARDRQRWRSEEPCDMATWTSISAPSPARRAG